MLRLNESSGSVVLHTSHLFDPKHKVFRSDLSIKVDTSTGLIEEVLERCGDESIAAIAPQVRHIDLRGKTVLPGFADAHTHIFLHPFPETPSLNQMRDESLVERVLRATNHCRAALLAGYTTYRDLGTEGLGTADVNFRDSVNRGIIPGPRLFVATDPVASSGGYEVRQENGFDNRTMVPRISDPADGVYGVRAAVRRRIGAGADVIKFYADYRRRQLRFPPSSWPGAPDQRFPPAERNPHCLLFTQEEMGAIVAEARMAKAPVAAHASTSEAVIMAAKAGVTTVEHGYLGSDEALQAMKENGTIFVPTLAVVEQEASPEVFREAMAQTRKAYEIGVKLACGGDTGAFAHGDNAREMELMIQAGVPVVGVLQAATLHSWEACGGDLCGRKFGWWERDVAADIVALESDPVSDLTALRKVDFVMKDATIYKRAGAAVNLI